MKYCKYLPIVLPFVPNASYLPPAGYHRSALVMSLGGSDSTKILEVGGANYAFGKLKRWNAEGPTERNKKIVRFLVGSGHRQEHTLLSVDLALEWGDLELLEDVILKSIREGCTVQLSSDVVVRAWGVFTFDRTKHMSVRSPFLRSCPIFLLIFSIIRYVLQSREGY